MWTEADLTSEINATALSWKTINVKANKDGHWDEYVLSFFESGPVIVSGDRALQLLNAYAPKAVS